MSDPNGNWPSADTGSNAYYLVQMHKKNSYDGPVLCGFVMCLQQPLLVYCLSNNV